MNSLRNSAIWCVSKLYCANWIRKTIIKCRFYTNINFLHSPRFCNKATSVICNTKSNFLCAKRYIICNVKRVFSSYSCVSGNNFPRNLPCRSTIHNCIARRVSSCKIIFNYNAVTHSGDNWSFSYIFNL